MKILEKLRNLNANVKQIKTQNHDLRLQIGTLLAKQINSATSIQDAEFKVFSQFGDDGIIQFLVNHIPNIDKKFIEFGVETYEESNTRFLLMNNNWSGLVIDGSEHNVSYIKNDSMYWRYDLTAVEAFITIENINNIIKENNFADKIGILSIDIDGNDYWIWEAITVCDPAIVVIEYNSLFGPVSPVTVPYKADFNRIDVHYSGLYFGASIQALCHLAFIKGYSFVGSNLAGNNAYFVKNSLVGGLQVFSPEGGYVQARFREARDINGKLTYADEESRRKEILGLPVVNVKTGLTERL